MDVDVRRLVWVLALLPSAVLVALKVDGTIGLTWWTTLSPLFVALACWGYFLLIVVIRLGLARRFKPMLHELILGSTLWASAVAFVVVLTQKLSDETTAPWSAVLAPLWVASIITLIWCICWSFAYKS